MNTKAISLIIGLTVAITLCATVLVPVIDDAQDSTYTYKDNLNSIIKTKMDNDLSEELTFTFDKTAFTYPDGTTGSATNIVGSTFYFNYQPQTTWWYGDYYDLDSGKISGVSKMVIHTDGSVTITYGQSNTEYTSAANSVVYYPDVSGPYALVANNSSMISDNKVAFCAIYTTTSSIDSVTRGVLAIGEVGKTINEATTAGILDISTNTFSEAELSLKANIITEYNGYYGSSGRINISGTSDYGNVTTYTTYPAKIVGIQYHEDGEDTPIFKMLNIIPLFVIIAILTGAIGLIVLRKN